MTSASGPNSQLNVPKATGVAPWERHGDLFDPHSSQAQEQAQRWQAAAQNFDAAQTDQAKRRRRAERAAIRKQRDEEERQRELEDNARRMYYIGFFLLPLVWLISLVYFYREHRLEGASPVIKKYYKNSRFMLLLYTAVFVTWFIVFQVYSESALRKLNIIFYTGESPSGF